MQKTITISLAIMCLATAIPTNARALPTTLPSSMASTGDSITRAFDVCCFLGIDQPSHSWSTGYDSTDSITSHYEHILAKNAAIKNNEYNDAKTGAKMIDLQGQVHTAGVTNHAQYVTILMGANDICTSTIAGMTPTATFQSQFQAAINDLKTNDAGAVVYVLSIPNIYQLWSLEHTNSQALSTWKSFNICQSMLSSSNTETDRQNVLAHEKELNGVLASLTTNAGANFYWDGNATFNYNFVDAEVSHIDYFHPSLTGQASLAKFSWAAGPYATLA